MANLLAGKLSSVLPGARFLRVGAVRIAIAGLPKASRPCHDRHSIEGRDHAHVSDRARRLMADDPTPPSPDAGREALTVWVKFLGLLAGLVLFCLVVFRLTRMLA